MPNPVRAALWLMMAVLVVPAGLRADGAGLTAAQAVRAAVQARLGPGADVTVTDLDGVEADDRFVEARPAPMGRLGKPTRFTFQPVDGRPVYATVKMTVVADHLVARRRLERGATVTAEDVEAVRGELTNVPLRELPSARAVVGGRVLRPIDDGAVVLPGAVVLRRSVEPGDEVTVTAVIGRVEISGTFIASDGGRPGDVIRLMNPASKRYIRGRIVRDGVVEVFHEG